VGLHRRGFDVVTTTDAGNKGASDAEQLEYAAREGRCLFTFNRGDFANLHGQFIASGRHHSGILLARQMPVGAAVKVLAKVLSRMSQEDLEDRLVWLKV
jgi:predicted nuclease of predicted toxin-antitoxin system